MPFQFHCGAGAAILAPGPARVYVNTGQVVVLLFLPLLGWLVVWEMVWGLIDPPFGRSDVSRCMVKGISDPLLSVHYERQRNKHQYRFRTRQTLTELHLPDALSSGWHKRPAFLETQFNIFVDLSTTRYC